MATRQSYNRYSQFVINGNQTVVPYINLPSKTTDKRFVYKVGQSRMDKISQQYYGSGTFGWLILMANPNFGGLEQNIPDNTTLVIPFPS